MFARQGNTVGNWEEEVLSIKCIMRVFKKTNENKMERDKISFSLLELFLKIPTTHTNTHDVRIPGKVEDKNK